MPDRPPLPVPGLWARRPADGHIWRPGRVGHVQKGARQSLPSEGTASGALSPAWARLGAGAQLSVSPPRPPPGHTPVRVDSGDCTGARGLAGRDPRECIHSNQLSEDWVPMGLRLLSAGAGSHYGVRLPLCLRAITTSPQLQAGSGRPWSSPGGAERVLSHSVPQAAR